MYVQIKILPALRGQATDRNDQAVIEHFHVHAREDKNNNRGIIQGGYQDERR